MDFYKNYAVIPRVAYSLNSKRSKSSSRIIIIIIVCPKKIT